MAEQQPTEGVRLRLTWNDAKYARVFDAGERLDVIQGWIDVDWSDAELVDVTTYPPRLLQDWSATLQRCGLWPSARLVIRTARTLEITARTVNSDETVLYLRPDQKVCEIGIEAMEALPNAFPGLAMADAPRLRIVYNGQHLDSDQATAEVLPRRGATVFLVAPVNTPTEERTTLSSVTEAFRRRLPTARENTPRFERRTCRICFEEELVDTWATTPAEQQRRPQLQDILGALGRYATAATQAGRTRALSDLRRLVFGPPQQNNRLISPCLCSGTMRYVHVDCLNNWRSRAPTARSLFRCDQCGYEYRVQRTKIAAFFLSIHGALLVAFILLSSAVLVSGECAVRSLTSQRRRQLYFWLRLSPSSLTSRSIQVIVLGAASVGLAMFLVYVLQNVLTTVIYIRLGVRWRRASEPLVLLGLWVAAETIDLRRARALAVVGFAVSAQLVFAIAFTIARRISTSFADRILDISAS